MAIRELSSRELVRRCDLAGVSFETTDDLEMLDEIVGQPRAVESVRFGTDIGQDGYNIFAMGPEGVGKHSLVRLFLEGRAAQADAPDDWCYVNNFDEPYKPRALSLPPGRGPQFRDDMDQLLEDVQAALAGAFEGEEYQQRQQQVQQRVGQEQRESLEALQQRARQNGLTLLQTPAGLVFAPVGDEGEPMTPDEIEELSEDKRGHLEERARELQDVARRMMQKAPAQEREARREIKKLNQHTAERALAPLIQELRRKYEDQPGVLRHIEAVQKDLIENGEALLKAHHASQMGALAAQGEMEASGQMPPGLPQPLQQAMGPGALLRPYRVNVLVQNDPAKGAPLVYEDRPNYTNLTGHVDYLAQMGALVADFTLIKPGALHRANGGYLILDVVKVLTQPQVWDALKRSLRAGKIRIEGFYEALGFMRTVSLEPEPIPLKIKVVLMGSPMLYLLLRQYDPEFAELFKVPADFDTEMARGEDSQATYARLVTTLVRRNGLKPFTREAVCRVIERASRLAGDSERLSIHMRTIADLLQEADYWARHNGNGAVTADDVSKAVGAQLQRVDRMYDRIQEEIERENLLVETDARRVGQVNGLAVFPFGDFYFGRPSRITARTRMGKGDVVDIEREVALGGPLHSKGVLILAGFLAERYARRLPLSLHASLVFEQSYGGIEGDSASSAELYALLSSIAGMPLKQSLAVTGSVDQHGQVQPIGGVNEKVEGFFDVCRRRGLTGEQGVIIPRSNVKNLMLRDDVVQAVEQGRFHLYAVATIDEGMELLTDLEAGEADAEGRYRPDTVNGKVLTALEDFANRLRDFAKPLRSGD